MDYEMDLCSINKDRSEGGGSRCGRSRGQPEDLSYQQQILSQAKNLGQLRRHYVVRKCFEDRIDEKKALADIGRYRKCYPNCSELQLLQILVDNKACPDTIIYQTYVVEADKGKCAGADEAFRKLKQRVPKSKQLPLPRPCCDEHTPIGRGLKQYASQMHKETPMPQQRPHPAPRRSAGTSRPQPIHQGTPRPQPIHQGTPYPIGPPRPPTGAPPKPCSPCAATPQPCPGPIPPTPIPTIQLTPCETSSPCPSSGWGQPSQSSTPLQKGAAAYFGSPGQTPAFLRSPGQTPVTKRKTRIPVAIRQDLTKSQKRQARDTTGSRIPCPISTQVPRSTRFSRIEVVRPLDPASRRKISFGGTQVSYFEDTIPGLVTGSQIDESQLAVPLSPATPTSQPKQFKEYKSMIDQEKKEIREMHNVVTQLMERPEKVEFRDMYSLVPQISYIDETLTDTAPEVVAAMLHSDELGLNLKSPPTEVYNTLFKGGDLDKTLIKVIPQENAKNVAPLNSEGFEATLLGYEQQGLFENVSSPEMEYDLPEMPQRKKQEGEDGEDDHDTTLKPEDEETPEKKQGKKAKQSPERQPGEDSQEQLQSPRLSSIHSRQSEGSDDLFDVELQIDLHSTSDYLQIRGSQPPSWFPGYYVAMGEGTEINVVRKPWDILEKAWRKFEPSTLKPENGTYVLGI